MNFFKVTDNKCIVTVYKQTHNTSYPIVRSLSCCINSVTFCWLTHTSVLSNLDDKKRELVTWKGEDMVSGDTTALRNKIVLLCSVSRTQKAEPVLNSWLFSGEVGG